MLALVVGVLVFEHCESAANVHAVLLNLYHGQRCIQSFLAFYIFYIDVQGDGGGLLFVLELAYCRLMSKKLIHTAVIRLALGDNLVTAAIIKIIVILVILVIKVPDYHGFFYYRCVLRSQDTLPIAYSLLILLLNVA